MQNNTANYTIKKTLRAYGLYYWEIADHIGVSESTLIRWLRKELSHEKKELLINAAEEIQAAKEKKKMRAHLEIRAQNNEL